MNIKTSQDLVNQAKKEIKTLGSSKPPSDMLVIAKNMPEAITKIEVGFIFLIFFFTSNLLAPLFF